MLDEKLVANGVSGLTGEYLIAPLDPADIAARAVQLPQDPALAAQLVSMHTVMTHATFGIPLDVDPSDLVQAGWAIVFSTREDDDVKAALEPLVEHRRKRVGDARTKVLEHRPGEDWTQWLARYRTAPGTIEPNKVPYYVLLVGGPDRIPFSFQYLLDFEYAVGRLDFDDADGYRRYVSGLIDYETADEPLRDAVATFFGTRHAFDGATRLSADLLVTPLTQSFQRGGRFASIASGYEVDQVLGDSATKATLAQIFSGSGATGRPALFFSASHGIGGWPSGHAEQRARHGALLCQDWPGIGKIDGAHYFAGSDLAPDASVHGLIAFFFACFGAGTPHHDSFVHKPGQLPLELAPEAFVGALPKSLLSHPQGGALAVIGHIDRAWGYSFLSAGEAQLLPFQNALGRILLGEPVGYAMKDFNEKYGALSANLASVLKDVAFGEEITDRALAALWTEHSDSQNYIVLGDPAAAIRA